MEGFRTYRCDICRVVFNSLEEYGDHCEEQHFGNSTGVRQEWNQVDAEIPGPSRRAESPLHILPLDVSMDDLLEGLEEPERMLVEGSAEADDILDNILDSLLDFEGANMAEAGCSRERENSVRGNQENRVGSGEVKDADLQNYKTRLCPLCTVKFKNAGDLDFHRFVFHPEHYRSVDGTSQMGGGLEHPNVEFIQKRAAGRRRMEQNDSVVREYEADLTGQIFADVSGVANTVMPSLTNLLQSLLTEMGAFKVICTLHAEMSRRSRDQPDQEQIERFPFNSFLHSCLEASMIQYIFQQMYSKISLSLDSFVSNGSGWKVKRFVMCQLRILSYRMDRPGIWIPTPDIVKFKRCVINIRNMDDHCFKYCILAEIAAIYKEPNADWYTYTNPNAYDRVDSGIFWECVNFPMTISQLDKFLHFNPFISVNVYGFQVSDELDRGFNKKQIHVFPLYVCKEVREVNVDLLLIIQDDQAHYTLLRSSDFNSSEGLSRLLGKSERNYEKFICRFCLCYSKTQEKLEKHQEYCASLDLQRVVLPSEKHFHYTIIKKTLPTPFVVYLDFEAILSPIAGIGTRQIGDVYNEHIDCGWSFLTIGADGSPFSPVKWYCGKDAALKLIDELVKLAEQLFPLLKQDVGRDPRWKNEDFARLLAVATHCIHCGHFFGQGDHKVVDHCHYTAAIRGVSCNSCNLMARGPSFIPVICHGFRHYDSKFILQALRSSTIKKAEILASSSVEKFTALKLTTHSNHVLRLIDSFQFISSSLGEQVKMLSKEGPSKFPVTSTHFEKYGDKLNLLFRKGVYPYSYFDSFDKFEETCLPPASAWTSDLTGKKISEADLQHAHDVWKAFNCKTLRDYHNIYVILDTCLLADCFQNFRRTMLESFRLDPAHYLTLPGVAYEAAMLAGQVHYEYLDEIEKYTYFERGIRGGICAVGQRYAKANNKYMGAAYNPNEPSSYICFWDANLLYSTCLRNFVPWKGFRWVKTLENRTTELDDVVKMLHRMKDDAEDGLVLEVDLCYPPELHDAHNDYPLAVERKEISHDILSDYSKQLLRNIGATPGSCKQSKLVGNLCDKQNYIVHYRLLKLYLKLGLKLTKVHRAIRFLQAPLFRVYTDICIDRRRQATNPVDRKFYKSMGNILAGKVYQNVRKYRRINIALTRDKMFEYGRKPTVEDIKIIHDNCVLFVMKKLACRLDKPLFVGQCILDDSKRIMYSFYYNYLQPRYQENMRLIYTDTDSFMLHIKTEDLYKDMSESVAAGEKIFDTSTYDRNNPTFKYLWSDINEGVGGSFKDECANEVITEAVALKPKVYAIKKLFPDGTYGELKKAKGTVRSVVERSLHFEDYKRVLFEGSYMKVEMNTIRSHNQKLYTTTMHKTSLSAVEDKAFYYTPIDSLKYGHYRIALQNTDNIEFESENE